MPNAAMIFAAGFGTRMKDLTRDRPKPMIEVAGKPLIDHALDLVSDAGVKNIVVNTHYFPDQIAAHVTPRGVLISDEREAILETGGGLKKAIPLLKSNPVITLNSDAVWTGSNPITTLKNHWDPTQMDALLLLVPLERATGYQGEGNFIRDKNGRLSRGKGPIYSGCQIIKTDRLATISDTSFSLNLLWDDMLADGKVFGAIHDGGWCDVGRPEGIQLAENLLNADV